VIVVRNSAAAAAGNEYSLRSVYLHHQLAGLAIEAIVGGSMKIFIFKGAP